MIISKKNITLEFSEDVAETDKCLALVKSYDLYTSAIDDGAQRRAANQKNKNILAKLKSQGVISVTFKNHIPMMSNEAYDYKIEL